mmetsp:Transcript_26061/g.42598  ORF Transcript_26061/g.42598 Transcript_26061/m.42598 type:complete len:81 (+) Transcript_26061:104-346(+)
MDLPKRETNGQLFVCACVLSSSNDHPISLDRRSSSNICPVHHTFPMGMVLFSSSSISAISHANQKADDHNTHAPRFRPES